jgi:hypothetical protein
MVCKFLPVYDLSKYQKSCKIAKGTVNECTIAILATSLNEYSKNLMSLPTPESTKFTITSAFALANFPESAADVKAGNHWVPQYL